MINQIKEKYKQSGFLLKEEFDEKFASSCGDDPEWKAKNTELLFSMMSVLPYFTLRAEKLSKLNALPNFNRFFFYSAEKDLFNVFLSFSYKHVADLAVLKGRIINYLWEELSITKNIGS